MMTMELIVSVASIIVGGITVAILFFFHTGEFEKEYKDANDRIMSVLRDKYMTQLDEMQKERTNNTSEEGQIDTLFPYITNLSEKGGEIIDWRNHILNGKKYLRRSGYYMFLTTFFSAIGIIFYSLFGDSDLGFMISILILYIPIYSGFRLYQCITKFCRIQNEIDEKSAEIF